LAACPIPPDTEKTRGEKYPWHVPLLLCADHIISFLLILAHVFCGRWREERSDRYMQGDYRHPNIEKCTLSGFYLWGRGGEGWPLCKASIPPMHPAAASTPQKKIKKKDPKQKFLDRTLLLSIVQILAALMSTCVSIKPRLRYIARPIAIARVVTIITSSICAVINYTQDKKIRVIKKFGQ
jgi:hypothetical protein